MAEALRSRTVGFLKLFLPLAALMLMATVFLVARSPLPQGDVPYAQIEEIAREPRVSGARLGGVAEDGSIFEITARRAQPVEDLIRIEGLVAIVTTGLTRIELRAGQGEVDNLRQLARLSGLARVESSTGYSMETTGLTADMRTGRIVSDGPLEVQAPFGELTAGQLVIETDPELGQRMLFQSGVRLLYTPQQQD